MSQKSTLHVGGDNLSIGSLHFSYGGVLPIFKEFNVEVEPGEFLAVLGPSGCGKTTLLNLLSGFFSPDLGQVTLRGETMTPEDPHLGYVF